MKVFLPLIAVTVPLVIAPHLLFHFDITPKIAVFLLGVAFLQILCIRGDRGILRRFDRTSMGRRFAVLLGAQWLWLTLTTLLSTNPELSLSGSGWRRLGFLEITALFIFAYLSAAWMTSNPHQMFTLQRVWIVAGAFAAVYGIGQYFGVDAFQDAKSYQVGEAPFTIVRPPGPIGHADYFAAWLLPIVFIALGSAGRETTRWAKNASYMVSVLAVVAIGLSGTRAAVLGLVIGIIAYLLTAKVSITARSVATCICGLVACALFVISPAGAKVRGRLYWSSQDALGGARILLWRDSIRMILERPGIGYGPETFATEFPRTESIELARSYPDFYHESAHNFLLDVCVNQGIPGLILFSACILLAVHAGWVERKNQSHEVAPLLAALASVFVCHQFEVFVLSTALSFYLVLAMLVAIAICPDSETTYRSRFRWLVCACSAGAALGMVVLATRLLIADRELAVARRFVVSGDVPDAARAYAVTLRWLPEGGGNDLDYSRAMAALASSSPVFGTRVEAFQQAFDAGIRASGRAEDRQNAWYNLAMLFAQKNDLVNVERCLRRAIAWAPNWFKPHWSLARVLLLSDHPSEALAEATLALERDGNKNLEVLECFLACKKRVSEASNLHKPFTTSVHSE